ncbi:Uma2 family endonuclease [Streptomyces californicus]
MRLAIDVVSPESRSRARETKPVESGRHLLGRRVEDHDWRAVVCVFERASWTSVRTPRPGIFRARMPVGGLAGVDLVLRAITRRRRAAEPEA